MILFIWLLGFSIDLNYFFTKLLHGNNERMEYVLYSMRMCLVFEM